MNIATSASTRASSRFLEHVRTLAGTGGAGRVGFRTRSETPKRHVGLVAAFRDADRAAMRRAITAGADAVEVSVANRAAVAALGDVLRDLEAPVGLVAPAALDDDLARVAAEIGADWIRLDLAAPVSVVAWERPARFLTIPFDIDLRVTGSLNGPFAEAVVVTVPGGEPWTLQLAEGLRLRTLGEIIHKPLLLSVAAADPLLSAAACEALGVDAVLLNVDGSTAPDRIAAYAEHLRHPAHEKL